MRASLRQVLFRSAAGLDLNFAGGVFSLNNTRTSNPANIPGWSFSRTDTNGTATALDLAGNVIQFATGVPRITNRGILVEEARTNVVPTSAFQTLSGTAPTQFPSGTGWSNFFATGGTRSFVPSTVVAGGQAASFAGVSAARNVIGFSFSPAASTTYTVSFFVEAASGVTGTVAYASGSLGVGGTTGLVSAPSATGRYSYTFTTGTGPGVVDLRFGIGASADQSGSLTISNVQLEAGAFATSPIITTGAAGTRGADVALVGSLTSFAYPLTMVGEWSREGGTDAATFYRVAALEPNLDDRSDIFQRHTTNDVRASQRSSGGVLLADITLGTGSIGSGQKAAVRFATDNVGGSLNGAAVVADTSVAMSASPIRLCVGSSANGASNYLTGYIRRIQVLPFAATNAQLQALTAP